MQVRFDNDGVAVELFSLEISFNCSSSLLSSKSNVIDGACWSCEYNENDEEMDVVAEVVLLSVKKPCVEGGGRLDEMWSSIIKKYFVSKLQMLYYLAVCGDWLSCFAANGCLATLSSIALESNGHIPEHEKPAATCLGVKADVHSWL